MMYNLSKEDVQALMESLYYTVEEIAHSPISEFYKKFSKLQNFCHDNWIQPDVGLDIWIQHGRNHKSIFNND